MYLTDLSTAVRASGLTVHEVSGWKTRGRGPMSGVKAVLCHHTGSKQNGTNLPTLNTLIHGRPGLSGPLCNLALGRDGSVYVVAAGRANHAGAGRGFGLPTDDANPWSIGIEAESAGTGDWTAAQLAAYPRLCKALIQHYHLPVSKVIGHLEWAPTRKIDPHGWPGGMKGLRAQTASASKPSGENVPTKTVTGGSTAKTQLTAKTWRTIAINGKYISMAEGPGRVTGQASIYLDAPSESTITLQAYTVRPDGHGGWVFASGNGLADFAPGLQHLRYDVAMTVPKGYLLRLRAFVSGTDNPVAEHSGFNLDVRS